VHDPDLGYERRPAGGREVVRVGEFCRTKMRDDLRRFGLAISGVDNRTESLLRLADAVRPHRRTAVDDVAQTWC
jgi:hypothetical protein